MLIREETPNLGFQYPLQTEQSYESATVGGHRTRAVKLIHDNIDYNTILIPAARIPRIRKKTPRNRPSARTLATFSRLFASPSDFHGHVESLRASLSVPLSRRSFTQVLIGRGGSSRVASLSPLHSTEVSCCVSPPPKDLWVCSSDTPDPRWA